MVIFHSYVSLPEARRMDNIATAPPKDDLGTEADALVNSLWWK